jgi:hypothetical protein
MGLHGLLQVQLYFYVDDVRALQETPMSLHGLLRGQVYFNM